jgi:hypothetical protein
MHPESETPATSLRELNGDERERGETTTTTRTRPRDEMYYLTICSNNVQGAKETKDDNGTRAYTKLEHIAIYMEDHNIDMYLLQGTWLEGYIDHWEINGVTFFTHGPETQTSSRGRVGLAIALSERAIKAWVCAEEIFYDMES